MQRFVAGDHVKILGLMANKYAGTTGIVKSAKYNSRDRSTLDKYLVEFENGEQAWFWSIQLGQDGTGNPDGKT